MTGSGGQIFGGEQWDSISAQPTTNTAATGADTHFMDLYPVDPALQPSSMDQVQFQEQAQGWYQASQHQANMQPQIHPSDGTGSSPDVNFESPVPFVWDTMSLLDGEAAMWANIGAGGDGFSGGIDPAFGTGGGAGAGELSWVQQGSQSTEL